MPRSRVPRGKFADDPLRPINGRVVQDRLDELHRSRRQLAKALGLASPFLDDVCTGRQSRCRASRLTALADALGVTELVLQGRDAPPIEGIDRWDRLVRSLALGPVITQDLLLLPWNLVDMLDLLGLDQFGAGGPGARKLAEIWKAAMKATRQHFTAYADMLDGALEVLGRDRVRRALRQQQAAITARFTLQTPTAKAPVKTKGGRAARRARRRPAARARA